MVDLEPGKCIVTISRGRIKDLIDTLNDAISTPDDEYSQELDLIDGDIKISKSIADPDIFWITSNHYTD